MTKKLFKDLFPKDKYNLALNENVRPTNWTNPAPDQPYHLVVLGAGPAGLVAAAGAARLGARVALIERGRLGGDCLNTGCIPSKCMLHSAQQAFDNREHHEHDGKYHPPDTANFREVMEKMRRIRSEISEHDSAQRFKDLGVDVYFGHGSFESQRLITVTRDDGFRNQLNYKRALIATGTRPLIPDIPGIETVDYLTHETLFSLTELPKRLGIIGGGPLGCEMAQAFSRLGSEVFLFEKRKRLLPGEDREGGTSLAVTFENEGIHLLLDIQDLRLQPSNGDLPIRVNYQRETQPDHLLVDQLLVATGRTPNTESLNLDGVGIKFNSTGVQVNPYLQTSNRKIYAAGDICSDQRFTHVADVQARAVIQNALFALGPLGRRKVSRRTVPRTTYTSPEIAQVGLTRAQARNRGIPLDSYVQEFSQIDRAIISGQTEGFLQVHTQKGSDRILGATLVCQNAGDMISQITLAMTARQGLSKLGSTIHPYPTHAGAIGKIADQFQATRLRPWSKGLLRWLRWLNVGS